MRTAIRLDDEKELYRRMKLTQGGVMLLVRLHADLAEEPSPRLRELRRLSSLSNLDVEFEHQSRLMQTVDWLRRKFGNRNAVMAIRETATSLLEVCG